MKNLPMLGSFDTIVYHANCDDGFASLLTAAQVYQKAYQFSAFYNGKLPLYFGKRLLVLDFSFKPQNLLALLKECKSLVLLDHHIGAMRDALEFFERGPGMDLGVITEQTATTLEIVLNNEKGGLFFDIERCGATLTHAYLHPNKAMPPFLKYIQDWDIWTKKLFGIEEFHAWVSSYPRDMDAWCSNFLFEEFLEPIEAESTDIFSKERAAIRNEKFYVKGQAICDYKSQIVKNSIYWSSWVALDLSKTVDFTHEALVRECLKKNFRRLKDGREVLLIRGSNTIPEMASEVGEALALAYNGIGLTWVEGAKNVTYSIRSRAQDDKQAPDISFLAKLFNGGGHAQASGFKTSGPVHSFVLDAEIQNDFAVGENDL